MVKSSSCTSAQRAVPDGAIQRVQSPCYAFSANKGEWMLDCQGGNNAKITGSKAAGYAAAAVRAEIRLLGAVQNDHQEGVLAKTLFSW